MTNEKLNRTFKDSVFSSYFSENNARMVELYNAIEGTNYPLDTPVEENTLEDVLYKDKINDLSFVLDGQILVLIEHQSTINNNMALRLLMYVGRLYEKIVNQSKKRAIYEEERFPIPAPKFVVLYNGGDEYPEHTTQYLSDAFMMKQEKPELELKIDIYNINYGKSAALKAKSSSIYEYSTFVHRANQNRASGMDDREAAKLAIKECINADIMAEYLLKHASEVENMLYTEWNMEEALEYAEEKGMQKGMQKGAAYGELRERENNIRKLTQRLSPEEIAETLQLPLDYVLNVLQNDMVVAEPEVPYQAVK